MAKMTAKEKTDIVIDAIAVLLGDYHINRKYAAILLLKALLPHKVVNDILNDSEIEIVAETIGGLHPAFEFVTACLKAGKNVVSSNKKLISENKFFRC